MSKLGELQCFNSYTYYAELYSSKEELSGESAICVGLPSGQIGYVPITQNTTRKTRIKTLSSNGKEYYASIIKKERYKDIASCEFRIYNYGIKGNASITYGSNFIQAKASGASGSVDCEAYLTFYDNKGEAMNYVKRYTEDIVPLDISINAYVTSSGSNNSCWFEFGSTDLIGNLTSYLNKDMTVSTRYDNSEPYSTNSFRLYAYTYGSSNVVVDKITFKSVKIAGREIPFTIVKA